MLLVSTAEAASGRLDPLKQVGRSKRLARTDTFGYPIEQAFRTTASWLTADYLVSPPSPSSGGRKEATGNQTQLKVFPNRIGSSEPMWKGLTVPVEPSGFLVNVLYRAESSACLNSGSILDAWMIGVGNHLYLEGNPLDFLKGREECRP
jgi:hypothetical protein